MNLGNAIEALCADDEARRAGVFNPGQINGRNRGGGSSWQSLARSAGSIETPYLNGEIVLIGSQFGVPTPANRVACMFAARAVAERFQPNTVASRDILAWADRVS